VKWAGGDGFPGDRWLVACQLNLLIAQAGTVASVAVAGIAAGAEAGIAAEAEIVADAEAVSRIVAGSVFGIAAAEVGKMLEKTAGAGTAAAGAEVGAGILAEGSAEVVKLVIGQTAQTERIRQSLEIVALAVGPSGSQRIQRPGSADATGHCQLDQRQTGRRSLLLKTGSKLCLSSAAGRRQ